MTFCHAHGLPIPRTNLMLFGKERDAVFEAEKVIVEIDTWDTHNSYHSFTSDRTRDKIAAEHGYLTIRLIAELLAADPHGEADSLHRTLARRRHDTSS